MGLFDSVHWDAPRGPKIWWQTYDAPGLNMELYIIKKNGKLVGTRGGGVRPPLRLGRLDNFTGRWDVIRQDTETKEFLRYRLFFKDGQLVKAIVRHKNWHDLNIESDHEYENSGFVSRLLTDIILESNREYLASDAYLERK